MLAWERTRPPKPMDSVRITAFLLTIEVARQRKVLACRQVRVGMNPDIGPEN